MISAHPSQAARFSVPTAQYHQVLIVSNDIACIKAILRAIQPFAKHICVATSAKEVNSPLNRTRIFQLICLDTAILVGLHNLMTVIQSAWPESELIPFSSNTHSSTETIQRDAYEIVHPPNLVSLYQ